MILNENNIASTVDTITNQTVINELKNFSSSMYCGIMNTLIGLDISQFPKFNQKNDAVMRFHMLRNDVQKSLLQSGMGENAYINGNPNNDSMGVPEYTYSAGHSYSQFSKDIRNIENSGRLTTSIRNIDNGSVSNKYFDFEHKDVTGNENALEASSGAVIFTGTKADNDSLLYKTKRLFNANKIKTIISQFHTDHTVRYDGQVGSSKYGESHGRNLLTKNAEIGINEYKQNGYDNPYCRVWTHHYQYDTFKKTMRAKSGTESINYWGKDFEWTNDELQAKNITPNSQDDSENYAYAWRGKHNQDRRNKYSVLDEATGLVKIAPKRGIGNEPNIHTKSCMFSIENLAWKDYDPYSFEQALSWEQRGPMGGRIMWFPPYNLKVTESNTAKWNTNDFIGRGESVYTYVNSERSGTLTFTMLVDHPSSIDYSMWYSDSEYNHNDNDYHRYFAGCFGEGPVDSSGDKVENNGGDNLVEMPPYMADEYNEKKGDKSQKTTVKKTNESPATVEGQTTESVEFYVYFPNNYSGVYDLRGKLQKNNYVDPILYLLFGKGAQKEDGSNKDLYFTEDYGFRYENFGNGYEMGENPLEKNDGNRIVGTGTPTQDRSNIFYYRVDCYLNDDNTEYAYNNDGKTNTINQILKESNCVDSKSFKLNSSATDNNLYSFLDVACALYDVREKNHIVNAINSKYSGLVKEKNVEKIKKLFKESDVQALTYYGTSSSDGYKDNNNSLAENRADTVIKWLKTYDRFKDVNVTNGGDKPGTSPNKNDIGNINAESNKKTKFAHVKIEFKPSRQVNQSDANSQDRTKQFTQSVTNNKANSQNQNDAEDMDDSVLNNNGSRRSEWNKLRYDQEYYFYRNYMADHPFVFNKLREKIKYFNPAFHSMTPEGFNGRLTFLNQCTRQGATMTRSDSLAGTTANNLAFGRPPFCVLRLGDFYHQMIVIESVSYNFDVSGDLQWDLNTEGNGVQPMLCDVQISFKFIGGGDIAGPVRRLQNAMSFNYYANTSFYDNRADRVVYEENDVTMGGAGNNKVLADKTYTFEPDIYKP